MEKASEMGHFNHCHRFFRGADQAQDEVCNLRQGNSRQDLP